jgi:hypothetical protein
MDRSQAYISMCAGAEEIQKQWVPAHGDFFLGRKEKVEVWVDRIHSARTMAGGVDLSFADGMPRTTRYIWLPRLDQLIELAQEPGKRYEVLTQHFFDWTKQPYPLSCTDPRRLFGSLEQTWLAFIMHKNWVKIWDGEGWCPLL